MSQLAVIQSGMSGVDMQTDPLFLPEDRLAGATNMIFEEGQIKTRPGFRYHNLEICGQFQGATYYSPSRGLSHKPFADPSTVLVVAAGRQLFYNLSEDSYLASPVEIKGDDSLPDGEINLFQAENYLIAQSPLGNTLWWEGFGSYVISPGLDADPDTVKELVLKSNVETKKLVGANIDCCFQKIDYCDVSPTPEEEEDFGSHDTTVWEKHKNFLINSAGLGAYAHGRVHQDSGRSIYVSDLIHKRGARFTDDILLMEEQQAGSFGDPLSTNSRLGQLRAMEVLPSMNTANGDGVLVAYYDTGVVSFDTAAVPRETRYDPVENTTIQKGWSEIRQVNHLLNRVSATGRYAVGILPRDHAFRSRFGIHLLRTSLGEGSFNDEFINTLSQDVQPVLDADEKFSLRGTTVGHWVEGHRLLTSVGMYENEVYSTSSMGRGFVVWNQATTFTEDRTPRPIWEGVWSPHYAIAGIHRLIDMTPVGGENFSGFVASQRSTGNLVFGEIDKNLGCDILEGEPSPIEWDVTSRKVFGGFGSYSKITEGRVELESCGQGGKVRVMIRSDVSQVWAEWHSEKTSDSEDSSIFSINLGQPPKDHRLASWFQFRVEGVGKSSLRLLEIDLSRERSKMGKVITNHGVDKEATNFHRLNTKPVSDRWS